MNYDNEADETFYDLEKSDYLELARLHIKSNSATLNAGLSQRNKTDIFNDMLNDLQDLKYSVSLLKAEVQSLHNTTEIILEKLK